MDSTEWIALAMVAGAFLFLMRRLFFSKKGSCCDKKCEALKLKPAAQKKKAGKNSSPEEA